MPSLLIFPGPLKGELIVPPSKSHTMRALFFGLMSQGISTIEGYLASPDTEAMLDAIQLFGACVHKSPHQLIIQGTGQNLSYPNREINCSNSGQILRFMGALAALNPCYTIFTGDDSICANRPIQPLIDALSLLGAFAVSSRNNGRAPFIVKGPIQESKTILNGEDSQPVSGLIMMGCFAPHPIEIEVKHPGERPWIDLTLSWLERLKIPFQRKGFEWYRLEGNTHLAGFQYKVPGDFSSAAFPIAAALITGSELTLKSLDFSDAQGDKKLISILQEMGAQFEINQKEKTLMIHKGPPLKGIQIDVNDCVDALPILAVLGCYASSPLEIKGGEIARYKESDRIDAITKELKKMGAQIEERSDGLLVHPSPLHGAHLDTHHDHRLALALAVASLGAKSSSRLSDVASIAKSYPCFVEDFQRIGAFFCLENNG